jgi:hypothetical protein
MLIGYIGCTSLFICLKFEIFCAFYSHSRVQCHITNRCNVTAQLPYIVSPFNFQIVVCPTAQLPICSFAHCPLSDHRSGWKGNAHLAKIWLLHTLHKFAMSLLQRSCAIVHARLNRATFSSLIRTGLLGHHANDQMRWMSDEAPPKNKGIKKKKKKKGDTDKSDGRDLEFILACINAPYSKEPPISEEEKARRYEVGRNYVKGMFRENNIIDHDLTCKIKLKKHAMKMLPKDSKIRVDAYTITDDAPPYWRRIPTWTPPIPGFDISKFKR